MGKFAILLNGEVTVTQRLRDQLTGAEIIAADGGIRHATGLGVTPAKWIGDFDSSPPDLQKRWQGVRRETHPREKNETDGALAIASALAEGAREIVLVGCLGGRADQVLSHLLQLAKLHATGCKCYGTSGTEEAWPFSAEIATFANTNFPPESRVSIVGLSDLENLTLSGVKWPLENRDVPLASTLTISNRVEAEFTLSCTAGNGIIFAGFDTTSASDG